MKKNHSLFVLCILFLASPLLLTSCLPTIDVFEKDVAIPQQQWQTNFQPQVTFTITDTTANYDVSLVVRHTDAYNFNNIWIKATVQQPGDSVTHSQRYNLILANNEKGWFGSAMDDIYEHRVLIQPQTKFKKAGDYHFTLEQVMREDPLQHVLNVGVRVEKSK